MDIKKIIKKIIITSVMILLVLILKGFDKLMYYSDAFFLTGMFFIGWGALGIVGKYGGHDMFGYAGYYLFNRKSEKYHDYVDYCQQKDAIRSRKKHDFSDIIYGGILILISTIILFLI